MAGYSIGFMPDMSKAKELKGEDSFFTNYEFNGQELLEVSAVTIPSNREALQSMAKSMAPRDFDLVMDIIKGFEKAPEFNPEPEAIVRVLDDAIGEVIQVLKGFLLSTSDITSHWKNWLKPSGLPARTT